MKTFAPQAVAPSIQSLAKAAKRLAPDSTARPFSRACRRGSRAKRTRTRGGIPGSYDAGRRPGFTSGDVAVDELDEFAARQGAENPVGYLPVLEEDESRDRRDLVLKR